MDLRAEHEERLEGVAGAEGAVHGAVEAGHDRPLATVFGGVEVSRLAYRHRGEKNLYPADAVLNLPTELYSHGLRRMAAVESTRGSFDEAVAAVERATGQHVPKRQVEGLAQRTAVDFEAFYQQAGPARAGPDDVLVISADGKGIVMRPEALRPGTAKAAAESANKLAARLSKGEKRNRKRMAEVGAVYDVSPVPRRPEDIMGEKKVPTPVAKAKWLTASVVDDAKEVISAVFDEAERRDPAHERTWVALVDGARHQIDVMKKQAKKRGVELTVLCDFVHVLEYIWKAAWSFFDEGDPTAEAWVKEKATEVLRSRASVVAGSIRRKATCLGLSPSRRANADACAGYLIAKAKYLDYAGALAKGWPIATGIIEGAARYLVADRLDVTGARWGLEGAEAVLKLRSIRSNDDFPSYWAYHLAQERRRVHESRYAEGIIPRAA
ncbi:MAG: ISKra4 family transposase [Actinomycetota bacterium]|nr:ISKra4 family transposase [Actinomycetota bacterium]